MWPHQSLYSLSKADVFIVKLSDKVHFAVMESDYGICRLVLIFSRTQINTFDEFISGLKFEVVMTRSTMVSFFLSSLKVCDFNEQIKKATCYYNHP